MDPRNTLAITELAEELHRAPSAAATAEQIVGYAREQLDADHAGITLLRRRGRLETVAPSSPVVEEVDRWQYDLDEGPCRDSTWEQQALVSRDLAADRRWPRWAVKASELGVAAVLAVELTQVDGRRIGSLNNYWSTARTFSSDEIAAAHILARHAALALASKMEIVGLNLALDSRKLIGQAQGILMERHDLDQGRAFEVLRRYSQDNNLKLRHVAELVVASCGHPDRGEAGLSRR